MSAPDTMGCDPQLAANLLRALAHPMRLAVLCRLMDGELSVSGFELELGLRQPSLSQQLALLREAGLVTTRREAKSVVYGLTDQRVAHLFNALHQYFDTATPPPALGPAGPGAPRTVLRQSVRPPVSGAEPHSSTSLATAGCGVFAEVGWHQTRTALRTTRHG